MKEKVKGDTNIAQLNIFVAERAMPWAHNGYYTLVFQRELDAIMRDKLMVDSQKIILMFLVAHVDNRNTIMIGVKEISDALGYSLVTVYRALDALIKMRLICRLGGRQGSRKYELTSKLLNPRLAFYGNSQKLIKSEVPTILCPDGKTPILPEDIYWRELPGVEDGGDMGNPLF